MTTLQTITVDQFLPHSPARVWRALTDPELLARWLMPNDFEARVGHRFTFDAGPRGTAQCEVLALEINQMLQISWRNRPLDTVVTWRLEPEGTGTRLFVEQSGFDLDDPSQRAAFDVMGAGWAGGITQALADLLARLPMDTEGPPESPP